VADNHFQKVGGDPCLMNPLACGSGLSVSLFYRGQQDPLALAQLQHQAGGPDAFARKYILSTGGARGFPGVGIFIAGPYLGIPAAANLVK